MQDDKQMRAQVISKESSARGQRVPISTWTIVSMPHVACNVAKTYKWEIGDSGAGPARQLNRDDRAPELCWAEATCDGNARSQGEILDHCPIKSGKGVGGASKHN